MRLTYVIVTHRRRRRLLETLARLPEATSLPAGQWEVCVVDNASLDGTAEALVTLRYPAPLRFIERPTNEGVAARNHGIDAARGEHVVLLDDDSYPIGDTVERSMTHLDAHPRVAAVVGRAVLPDGRFEACALPEVLISCAVMLRRDALREVGGFREEFFRKAGEYDLSYRLWDAGWRVERFEDLVYRHDKHLAGRCGDLAAKLDLRNNLILVERFLPREMRRAYRRDTLRRYAAIARHEGRLDAAREAVAEAREWADAERHEGRPERLRGEAIETLFGWERQARDVRGWAVERGVRRVVVASYAKNLYATWQAARRAGLEVAAVADDGPAFAGLRYRGVPVLPFDAALAGRGGIDGVVVANVNPGQIDGVEAAVRERFAGPVLKLWRPARLGEPAALSADRRVA